MKYFLIWLGVAVCLAGSMISSRAADSTFLNIPGIPGESTVTGYQNQIAVTTFSLSIENVPPVGTGTGSGKVQFNDIVITKPIDKSSPLLYFNCAKGAKLTDPVVLTVTRTSGMSSLQVVYTLTLTSVFVKSLTTSTDADGNPQETLTLICAGNMQWSYTPYNASGQAGTAITHSWNISSNTGN